jgi:hypothetical protein
MKSRMALALLMVLGCRISTFSQQPPPTLEQIKIAADAGNPAAQDKLAERDSAHAEVLYRKAAEQGYAHAQGRLGNLLLMRSQLFIGVKPEVRAAIADEAIKWATLAANQGDKQGQANLAQIYLEGKWVKQDLIEAYKWGDLSDKNPSPEFIVFSGRSFRDAAILKMNADQIAEAHKRVAAFTPHKPGKDELPEPAWVKKIKLNGISGPDDKRLALIGNHTFEKGERKTVKIDGQSVAIQCLEITATTATISIEGIVGTRTLNLN